MKILVIGAMHGNEPLGAAVVEVFRKNPVIDVDVVIANERALMKNVRFTEQDLNRSFPGLADGNHEQKRALELFELCKRYDLVLDFHNTKTTDNDCGFVGETAQAMLYEAAWTLGFKRIIIADYECINKYAPNCVSIEISLDSSENNAELWYERISMLARMDNFSASENLERYRYVRQITLEERDGLDLPSKDLKAFVPLEASLARSMGFRTPVYPIFIGGGYTPNNYGGLLERLEDSS